MSDSLHLSLLSITLIGRCLGKIIQDQTEQLILIVPVRENQPWFPNLLGQLTDLPLLLPEDQEVLTNPLGEFRPLVENGSLHLVACKVSRIHSKIEEFQRTLTNSSPHCGEEALRSHTRQRGRSGCFGVISHANSNSFPSSISPVVNFLTSEFKEGKQYATMNAYRSSTVLNSSSS